jgi:hypothetical protein
MKRHDALIVRPRKMPHKTQLLLGAVGLLIVLVVGGLLSIIGVQSRLPWFNYQPIEPLILVAGTSASKDDSVGGSIWLIQVTGDGVVAKYELATSASANEAVNHSGFLLIECPSLPAMVCGYERLAETAQRQSIKVHQWQIKWPLGEPVAVQHEEQVVSIPASSQVTGVIREGILFQSKPDLTVQFLRFSDQSVIIVASTGRCSDRSAQQLSSRLSPRNDFLAYVCGSPLPSRDYVSDQYLGIADLNVTSDRRLSPEKTYLYDSGCSLMLVGGIPPYCWHSAPVWSVDGTQIAFVTALSAPIKLPGTKWPPDYQDAGAIYSVALDGTQWHEWVKTKGQTPYLDWSPDRQYLAYGLTDLNITSFTGGNWKIRDTELIQGLDWSPDGSYIAIRYYMSGAELVRTSDYTWQSVEVSGTVSNMLWLTPPAP